MEHLNHIIAGNLKEIRKRKELSLEQVSVLTSISKSMLSQLERGEASGEFSKMNAIMGEEILPYQRYISCLWGLRFL